MIVLALILGNLALVGLLVRLLHRSDEPTHHRLPADIATPYRDGLHAAIRLQTTALDFEHQLYAVAMRRAAESEHEGQPL